MDPLDKTIEDRLSVQETKQKHRTHLFRSILFIVIAMVLLLSIVFYTMHRSSCYALTDAHILTAEQKYTQGSLSAEEFEMVMQEYYAKDCSLPALVYARIK